MAALANRDSNSVSVLINNRGCIWHRSIWHRSTWHRCTWYRCTWYGASEIFL
jgi:hypothetical protein